LRLAQRVGADGRVYASDSQKANLDRLKKSLASHSLNNVKLVLGTGQDPRLPAGKLDLVLLVGIYHELAQPQDMLRKLRDALKPAGRLVLVEYRQDDPSAPARAGHKLTIQDFKSEIEPAGYRYEKVLGVLPRQHILVFVRN
jgi:ubiquinone/menaquinone biosynthesis C-methylase UbiE